MGHQGVIKCHPEVILNSSIHPETYWSHLGVILESSWSPPGVLLESSWSHPGVILKRDWNWTMTVNLDQSLTIVDLTRINTSPVPTLLSSTWCIFWKRNFLIKSKSRTFYYPIPPGFSALMTNCYWWSHTPLSVTGPGPSLRLLQSQ